MERLSQFFQNAMILHETNLSHKKVFITGANKGIGFATAQQLLQKGFYVYLGCRSLERDS
jgi:NAD(P)-dependent dehydrogenase (short-subunit alcohol dehydrogenase family)